MTASISQRSNSASIQEILLAAVALCGGRTAPADVEEVAVAAFQTAPDRFCWTRRPDQIDLEKVRSSLRFLSRREGGEAVIGSTKEGWLLTREGVTRCSETISKIAVGNDIDASQWSAAERDRLESEPAFTKWAEGKVSEVTKSEAAAFFCGPDAQESWPRAVLIQRLVNMFGDDRQMKTAIEALARRL